MNRTATYALMLVLLASCAGEDNPREEEASQEQVQTTSNSTASQEEGIHLHFSPQEGVVYKTAVQLKTRGVNMPEMDSEMSMEIDMSCVAQGEESSELEMTYRDISMKMQGMTLGEEVFGFMLHKPMTGVFDRTAKLKDIRGHEEIFADAPQGSSMDPAQLMESFENLFALLPEERVSEGDSWKRTWHQMGIDVAAEYTVKKITDKMVTLSIKAEGEGESELNGMPLAFNAEGDLELERSSMMTMKGLLKQEGSTAGVSFHNTIKMLTKRQ